MNKNNLKERAIKYRHLEHTLLGMYLISQESRYLTALFVQIIGYVLAISAVIMAIAKNNSGHVAINMIGFAALFGIVSCIFSRRYQPLLPLVVVCGLVLFKAIVL